MSSPASRTTEGTAGTGERMRRHGPAWLLGGAVIPALLLTACSAKGDPAPAATHHSGGAQADKKLTAQAQSALDAASDGGSSMVESGVERVSDGVHTRPGLTHGAAREARCGGHDRLADQQGRFGALTRGVMKSARARPRAWPVRG
ncbi:protein of unknown function [Streptomyces murinus]